MRTVSRTPALLIFFFETAAVIWVDFQPDGSQKIIMPKILSSQLSGPDAEHADTIAATPFRYWRPSGDIFLKTISTPAVQGNPGIVYTFFRLFLPDSLLEYKASSSSSA